MTLADDLQKSGGIPQPIYKVLIESHDTSVCNWHWPRLAGSGELRLNSAKVRLMEGF